MPAPALDARMGLVRAWMLRAIETEKGIEVTVPSLKHAKAFRNQFYTLRCRATERQQQLSGNSLALGQFENLTCLIHEQPDGTAKLQFIVSDSGASSFEIKVIE